MSARILVVDDNPTNLKLVCDVLECEGYEILRARDAPEAERAIAETIPDLVLLDIALPEMDGLTLTRKLRAEARTRNLVIVALTAFAMHGDEERAREAGCNGYITKPIDTRKLPGQVAGYLPAGREVAAPAPMKILVIEDAATELKLARLVLTFAGHDVNAARAAEQALEAIRQDRPDVILLDLELPGVNGLELARALKRDPETAGILIVAITAFPERFTEAQARRAGCAAFLVKPISTRKLSEQLESVVRGEPFRRKEDSL